MWCGVEYYQVDGQCSKIAVPCDSMMWSMSGPHTLDSRYESIIKARGVGLFPKLPDQTCLWIHKDRSIEFCHGTFWGDWGEGCAPLD